jgi:hypothetical protein
MPRGLWLLALLLAGCETGNPQTITVSSNPFGHAPLAQPSQVSYSPAALQTAAKVDLEGRRILTANPQLEQMGIRPLFRTIGAPQPEIFHRGTTEIDITEGLASKCTTDGQLAALLCNELGKMVAEREAQAGPRYRVPERPPPVELRIGNDNGGTFGPADQVSRAEQGLYEQEYRRRAEAAQQVPDPQLLAHGYLTKTGYAVSEFDAVAALLQAAGTNTAWAKQMAGANALTSK